MSGVRWATDSELLNIWMGEKGLVIGRGENPDYVRYDDIASFRGRKIGCNRSYRVYDDLDALVWLDHSFFRKHCTDIRRLKCHLFTVNTSINENIPLKVLRKGPSRPACTGSFDQGFWTKNLTGFVALNIALALGLDPIWLHGFLGNYKREHFINMISQFAVIADWCNDNGRTVYVADEDSALTEFFKHRRLPAPRAAHKKKGVMPYGMGQGRTGVDPVRLGDELRGRPDSDDRGVQDTHKSIDIGGDTAGSDSGDDQGLQESEQAVQGES